MSDFQAELFALLQRKNVIITDNPFPDEVEFDELCLLNSSRFFCIPQLSEFWSPPSDHHQVDQQCT